MEKTYTKTGAIAKKIPSLALATMTMEFSKCAVFDNMPPLGSIPVEKMFLQTRQVLETLYSDGATKIIIMFILLQECLSSIQSDFSIILKFALEIYSHS